MQKLFKFVLSFMAFTWFGFAALAVEVSSMRAYDITGYGDFLFQVEPLKFGEFSESGTATGKSTAKESEDSAQAATGFISVPDLFTHGRALPGTLFRRCFRSFQRRFQSKTKLTRISITRSKTAPKRSKTAPTRSITAPKTWVQRLGYKDPEP